MNRKTRKSPVSAELRTRFETSRTEYLRWVAMCDVLRKERTEFYSKHDDQTVESWETVGEPEELSKLYHESDVAMKFRDQARRNLIQVAEEVTLTIAGKYTPKEVESVRAMFDHLRTSPYSRPSQKAMDAILRLQIA